MSEETVERTVVVEGGVEVTDPEATATDMAGGVALGGVGGIAAGAVLGAAAGPVGAAIGAVIGAVAGSTAGGAMGLAAHSGEPISGNGAYGPDVDADVTEIDIARIKSTP